MLVLYLYSTHYEYEYEYRYYYPKVYSNLTQYGTSVFRVLYKYSTNLHSPYSQYVQVLYYWQYRHVRVRVQ